MNKYKCVITVVAVLAVIMGIHIYADSDVDSDSPIIVIPDASGITFQAQRPYSHLYVSVRGPGDVEVYHHFEPGVKAYVPALSGMKKGLTSGEGIYRYEATLVLNETTGEKPIAVTCDGSFRVSGGQIDTKPRLSEADLSGVKYHINDDLYVTGRMGVGDDMTDYASIPFETIRMYQNNCQIKFDDSSTVEGFPDNDWLLKANDTYSEGAEYFSIDDVTGGTSPFRIEAGAPDHSLYVESSGNIGIGTSVPSTNLHIKDSGTAYLRMERIGGGIFETIASSSAVYVGARSNHRLYFTANNSVKMTVRETGNVGIGLTSPSYKLHISGGAYCDGTTWVNASSREYKNSIRDLPLNEALTALEKLNPVKFKYNEQKNEDYLGFIAEDVPELVAMKDRKGLNAMDIVAVLTKVVQQQQKALKKQESVIQMLEEKIEDMNK